MKEGRIIAVCISNQPNVPKYPQAEIEVTEHGFVGDIHAGPTRISRSTGQAKFNDRQVSIVAQEALDFLNQELQIVLKPGDLGENITTSGIGDLSDLAPGMQIQRGLIFPYEIKVKSRTTNPTIYEIYYYFTTEFGTSPAAAEKFHEIERAMGRDADNAFKPEYLSKIVLKPEV